MRADADRAPNASKVPSKAEGNGDFDSYEAAMRAADALFTRAPAKPRAEERSRPTVSDEQPVDPRDSAREPTNAQGLSSEEIAGETAKANGIERSGRILRVIDEPAADPFAQMEAERAPKKRGRKPGSKNKPKPALTVVPALEASAEPAAAADETFDAVVPVQSPVPRPRAIATHVHSTSSADPTSSAYKAQRFSWVRKRLGPGEQWKRHLPKVIW